MRYTATHCGETVFQVDATSEAEAFDAYARDMGYESFSDLVATAQPWCTLEEAKSEYRVTTQ